MTKIATKKRPISVDTNVNVPKIMVTRKAWSWIQAIVRVHSEEVGFRGIVREIGDNKYLIDEIFYPKQCLVSGSTCEIDPMGEAEIANKILAQDRFDDIGRVKFWAHSHVNMSVSPSQQDEDQSIKLIRDLGSYLIRGIFNKSNEASFTFFDVASGFAFDNVDYSIVDDSNVDDKCISDISTIVSDASINSAEKINKILARIDSDGDISDIIKEVEELKKVNIPPATKSYHHPYGVEYEYGYDGHFQNWGNNYPDTPTPKTSGSWVPKGATPPLPPVAIPVTKVNGKGGKELMSAVELIIGNHAPHFGGTSK